MSRVWSSSRVWPHRRRVARGLEPPPTEMVEVLATVMLDPALTGLDVCVYALIDRLLMPEQAEIADLLGVTRNGVQGSIRRLEARRWLIVVRRPGQRQNRYVPIKRPPLEVSSVVHRKLRRLKGLQLRHLESAPMSPAEETQYREYLRTFCRKSR